MKILKLIMFVVPIIVMTGCETNRWGAYELKMIDEYIKSLEDTLYVKYPSGLYYIELSPGSGEYPADKDTVYFKYKAAFTDYVQFDHNVPYTTPYRHIIGDLNNVVSGVDEGLRYMKNGGKARLVTPSSLAWGFEGLPGYVAGYTPIVWTIELDSVIAGPGR